MEQNDLGVWATCNSNDVHARVARFNSRIAGYYAAHVDQNHKYLISFTTTLIKKLAHNQMIAELSQPFDRVVDMPQ